MAAFTHEEMDYLALQLRPYVVSALKAYSQEIDSVEVVSDPTGLTTIPAYDDRGGQKKVVRVDLELVIQNTIGTAIEDARDQLQDMQQATIECETQTELVEAAIEDCVAATEQAEAIIERVPSYLTYTVLATE